MRYFKGFAPLAAEYGGFVLDLWGVIHSGVRPYQDQVLLHFACCWVVLRDGVST